MNMSATSVDHEIATVIEVVQRRTLAFMHDELGLTPISVRRCTYSQDNVVLRSMTALVGVGSRFGLNIAYSYDDTLIRAMTARYAAGISIPAGQEDLYARETASDVVNVIVGNSTADLAQRGELITLSPPVLMVGAHTIRGRPETAIECLTLTFPEGALDIAFVGQRSLLQAELDRKEGHSL